MSGTLGDWSAAILATSPGYENAKRALESELLAMAVFDVVQRFHLLPDGSTFVGGTALRLCHGSPRLSEDLDFHASEYTAVELDRRTLREETARLTNCVIHASVPSGSGSTLTRISAEVPGRDRSQRRPRTKIDFGVGRVFDASERLIALRVPGGSMIGMGEIAAGFSFLTSSKEEIFADKHLALVGRQRRIKHRDIFDMLWLHQGGVEFRPELVVAKLGTRASDDFPLALRERAGAGRDAIRSGKYRDEMEHFLPSGSPWVLAEDTRRDLVALAFESMVLAHAKLVAREQTRVVTGPSRD